LFHALFGKPFSIQSFDSLDFGEGFFRLFILLRLIISYMPSPLLNCAFEGRDLVSEFSYQLLQLVYLLLLLLLLAELLLLHLGDDLFLLLLIDGLGLVLQFFLRGSEVRDLLLYFVFFV